MRPVAPQRHESTNTKEGSEKGNGNETNYGRNWGLTTLMTEGDVSRFLLWESQTNKLFSSPFSLESTPTML